ncbi:hypothetical protein Vau01_051030 [Virgisporangium aurantiacum]|uniref:Uncharacterized protein n=1 Tax=Virgisporangium aurantiacum TaxID=175570 RepID=A0A8J3Z617_9ACTN|nr:hypothetical protein Vau01_051030 [Virgisporangium aurantiacum]
MFRSSLLVALGWYVVVPAAVLVAWSGLPVAPGRDCSAMFSCLSPVEQVGLFMIFVGLPVLLGAAVVTVAVAALLARVVRWPVVTGTVSALCGVVGVAALVAAGQGFR